MTEASVPDLLLRDYKPRSMLKRPIHIPEQAKFPVIDAHNHLFGDMPADQLVEIMDAVGVKTFVNLTGNTVLPFDVGGYSIAPRDFDVFQRNYVAQYPNRFAAFTMSGFAQWGDFNLFKNFNFVEQTIQTLEAHVAKGACGLKVSKELGLRFTDASGAVIPVDDTRLFPIWKRAGELGIPVLMHTSDPEAFFLPIDAENEHYLTLQEFSSWSFYGSFYSKEQLLEQRTRLIVQHPDTTFIWPHVANSPEDLARVADWLDTFPNLFIDFSARMDELGRQPYSARDFMIRYHDRILFGTDMPAAPDVYRAYFRFLETRDEYFDYPDYLGRWGRCRWKIYGLHLPDNVLRAVYYKNAERVIPGIGNSI